jgi:hypothetical protein
MASSVPQSGPIITKRQSGTANQNLRGEVLVRHRDGKKSLNIPIEYIHHHDPSHLRVLIMVQDDAGPPGLRFCEWVFMEGLCILGTGRAQCVGEADLTRISGGPGVGSGGLFAFGIQPGLRQYREVKRRSRFPVINKESDNWRTSATCGGGSK